MNVNDFTKIIDIINKKKDNPEESVTIKFSNKGKIFEPSLFCLSRSGDIVVLLKDTKEKLVTD